MVFTNLLQQYSKYLISTII